MVHPLVLGLRLDRDDPVVDQVSRAAADPVHVLVIEASMFVSTDGLPGPEITKRFGKPATPRPRYVRGPADHFFRSVSLSRPRMSMRSSDPIIAS
jgi:hypothetical protein